MPVTDESVRSFELVQAGSRISLIGLPFEPIHTGRLILRQSVMGDLDAAIERRSIPEVAKYQDWELPYDVEHAKTVMAKLEEMDGPVNDHPLSVHRLRREPRQGDASS